MRLNYASRFWLFAPLVLLLGLVLWVSVHWWTVTGALDKKLTAMNGHEVVPGITLSYAGKSISGFPFNIDVVFTGFAVQGQGAHGPFRWSTENFALHGLAYGPAQQIYEAAGNQTLSWSDGESKSHSIKFLPGILHASAVANGTALTRFDLVAEAVGGKDGDGAPFTAAHAQFHLRRDPRTDALDLQVSGDDIKAASAIGPFGATIKNLSLYLTLTQGSAFAPLLQGKQGWAEAAAAWRGKGGAAKAGPAAVSSERLKLNLPQVGSGDLGVFLSPLY